MSPATGNGQAPLNGDTGTTDTPPAPLTQSPAERVFASPPRIPGPPEVSPDSSTLAMILPDDSGALGLWLYPIDGPPREVPVPGTLVEDRDPDTGRAIRGPQWSPDGTMLAVTCLADEPGQSDRTVIWLVPVPPAVDVGSRHHDEEDRAPILLCDHPAADRSPRWSPDGTELAFVSRRDGRDAIALAPALGGSPAQPITFGSRDDREPVWSRDGKFLAFRRLAAESPDHADLLVFLPETGEVHDLTGEKASAVRHSPEWVPGRNLIAYVTIDGEWQSIAVVNTDNKSGWTVTREGGDKTEPRFAPNEARLLYTRTEGFTTVCCERGLHASSATTIDPGEGVVRYPRWLAEKRVVFGFSSPGRPFEFVVQGNTAESERSSLALPGAISTEGFAARYPVPFEFPVGPDEQFSGLLYRTPEQSGPAPGIIYLPDGPLAAPRGEFQIAEQALAAGGMTVLTPVLHGATGFGLAVETDLAALADGEVEVGDIAEAAHTFGFLDDVMEDKLALVGHGFGGTLALLTAGGRPGIFSAVIAIDPILDWVVELDHAPAPWRQWIMRQYGTPLTHPDRYALRTPTTFAAVLDIPLLLVSTAQAPAHRRAQLDAFTAFLDAIGIDHERVETEPGPLAVTLREVERALRARFRPGAPPSETDDEPSADAPESVETPATDSA
ncbi:MAG: prolyl oligopeptidase family serine peptidase [Chloroflexota bacterium]|nr:prolyl oligopeptidase family serine peptidase [Chloroflexota bacterium]